MRHRKTFRQTVSILMILALVAGILPIGMIPKALAYTWNGKLDNFNNFRLDAATSNQLSSAVQDNTLTKPPGSSDAYYYTISTRSFSLSGSTIGVNTNSPIYAKVEQLVKSVSGSSWNVVSPASTKNFVQNSTDPRLFSGTIDLQDGMNKITFTGKNANDIGTVEEILYVRYDSSIFVNSFNLQDGPYTVPLENGTSNAVVASTRSVTIEANVTNATRIVLNGREYRPFNGKTFLVGPIALNNGLNALNLKVENSDGTSQDYTYNIYYYDKPTLFVGGKVNLKQGTDPTGNTQNVFDAAPTYELSWGAVATGTFTGTLIAPYTGDANADKTVLASSLQLAMPNATIANASAIHVTNAQPLRGGGTANNGFPYALYTVDFNFDYTPTNTNKTGSFTITGSSLPNGETNSSSKTFSFNATDNSKIYIKKVSYNGTTPAADLSSTQTTQVSPGSASFTLTTNAYSTGTVSTVEINTPFGNRTATVSSVTSTSAVATFTDLPSGEYTARFTVNNDPASSFSGKIAVNNTPSVIFKNLANGVTLDQSYLDNPIDAEIELTGLAGVTNFNASVAAGSKLIVNGTAIDPSTWKPIPPSAAINISGGRASFTAKLGDSSVSPAKVFLQKGENTVEFRYVIDGVPVTKRVITFFINDTRVPGIAEYKPTLTPGTGRVALSGEEAWKDSNGITYDKTKNSHSTYESKFNLLIQAYQVSEIEISMDGTKILNYKDPNGATPSAAPSIPPITVEGTTTPRTVDTDKTLENRSGSYNGQVRHTIRINDLDFDKSNIHNFVLKMVATNGSMVTILMEFSKIVTPYRVYSPQPTDGDQIIVNTNYVPIYIEAKNADEITIGKDKAVRLTTDPDMFMYQYVGLKENKSNPIKFTVVRGKQKVNGQINVYYGNTNQAGAGYMQKFTGNYKVLNGQLALKFPSGTVLRSRMLKDGRKPIYEGHNLLFGIADPDDGTIERKIYNPATKQMETVNISNLLSNRFRSLPSTFVAVSPVMYVHGGLTDNNKPTNDPDYQRSLHGMQPYEPGYIFTDGSLDDRMLEPSKRGDLTLTFDSNVRNVAGPTITVFRLNQDGRWENIGGVVNKNTIKVPFDDFGYYVVMRWRGTFEDMSNHAWARNVMEAMYSKGYMNAKQVDVEFGATDSVTRGEFAQLIVKALNLPLNADLDRTESSRRATFVDVQPSYSGRGGSLPFEEPVWTYKYLETAARAGIIKGIGGGLFGPNIPVTREQAAIILTNALNLKKANNDSKLQAALLKLFQDAGNMEFYSRPSIMAVNKEKIMAGIPNPTQSGQKKPTYNFYPKDTLTRAEAAAMMVRLMQNKLKTLPKDLDTTNPNGQF